MEHDRDSELVTRMGNTLYDELREAGITTPTDFQGYKLARELLFVARTDARGWNNQKAAILLTGAFLMGLLIGLPL